MSDTSEKEWWMELFTEWFPDVPDYVPRDRSMEQLKHIFDGDDAGEAVSDYVENQRELRILEERGRREYVKDFVEKIIAEAERRKVKEIREEIKKEKNTEPAGCRDWVIRDSSFEEILNLDCLKDE